MKAIKAKILSKVTALSMVWSSVLLTACMMSSIPDVTEVSERVLVNQSKGVSLLVYNDYRKPVILIEDSVPDWIVVKGLTSNTLNPLTAANLDLVIYCGANEEVRTATVLLKSPDNEVSKSINVSLECYSPNGGPAFPFLPPFGPNPFPSPTPEPAPPTTSPGTGLGPQPIVGDGSDGAYYVSTSGSDSNSGTLSRPFKTIEAAASRARPGDVIYIRGGVYPRTKIQGVHGQAGKPVTFRAFPGERVVLDGKTKGALNQENNVLWLYDKVSYVVFDGLEITDTNPDIDVMRRLDLNKEADVNEFLKKWASGINSKYPMGVRINPNGETGDIHDIVFKNMKVHHILNLGISIQNDTRNVTIENCYFANLGYPRSGYAVYTHNNGFIFRNNIVHTATYGLHIFSEHDHYMTNVRIENNLFHNIGWWPYYHISSKKVKPAGGRAIMLNKYGDNAVVRNNLFTMRAPASELKSSPTL
jgi:hypothetical protein